MNDCLIPKGEKTRLGYIRLWNKGNRILAHRAAYIEKYGEIPKGLEIDHICKNRSCANVLHLRAVTHTENIRNSTQTKLNKDQVIEILKLNQYGLSLGEISKAFNVTKQCIWQTIKKKNWKDIDNQASLPTKS